MMVGRLIRGRQGAAWALQAVLLALCVSYTVGCGPETAVRGEFQGESTVCPEVTVTVVDTIQECDTECTEAGYKLCKWGGSGLCYAHYAKAVADCVATEVFASDEFIWEVCADIPVTGAIAAGVAAIPSGTDCGPATAQRGEFTGSNDICVSETLGVFEAEECATECEAAGYKLCAWGETGLCYGYREQAVGDCAFEEDFSEAEFLWTTCADVPPSGGIPGGNTTTTAPPTASTPGGLTPTPSAPATPGSTTSDTADPLFADYDTSSDSGFTEYGTSDGSGLTSSGGSTLTGGTAPGPNGGPPITIDNNISTQNGADNSNSGNVIAADDSDDDDFPLDIVIGAGGGLLALLLVICAVCFFCCRRRKPKQLPPPVATQHPAPVGPDPWIQGPEPWAQGPSPAKPMTYANESSAYTNGSQAEWMSRSNANPATNHQLSIASNSTATGNGTATCSSYSKYNPTFESDMSAPPPHTPMHGVATTDSVTNYATQQAWAPMAPVGADATMQDKKEHLEEQLDQLVNRVVGGWLLVLPGTQNRLSGGQAVVQMVEDTRTKDQHAVKFFLSHGAFTQEKDLYVNPEQPLGKFLPQMLQIAEGPEAFKDVRGGEMAPCIVMEKGEALDVWIQKSGENIDMFTGLQVLSHIAERLRDLHAAGYVHRDLKPGNIMWLPRKKRWTLIDFGCAARTGTHAPTGFSLYYAAPEALQAYVAGAGGVQAEEALDAWSLGVLAIELFTAAPVFSYLLPREQTMDMILGKAPAPWEDRDTARALLKPLGIFKPAVLGLLRRDPSQRDTIKTFLEASRRSLANTSIT